MRSVMILYGHGSRDRRWRAAFNRLLENVRAHAPCEVKSAFLQFMTPTLRDAVREANELGISSVHILPIFLFAGQHVSTDIPEAVDRVRAEYPHLAMAVAPAVGEDESFRQLVIDRAMEIVTSEM